MAPKHISGYDSMTGVPITSAITSAGLLHITGKARIICSTPLSDGRY